MEVTKQATSLRVPSHLDTGTNTTDSSSISQFRGCKGRGFTPREDKLPRVPLMEMNSDKYLTWNVAKQNNKHTTKLESNNIHLERVETFLFAVDT